MLAAKRTVMSSIMNEAKTALNDNTQLPRNAKETVVEIPYKDIITSPLNEGLELETLNDLVSEMSKNGFKVPIIVYDVTDIPDKEGKYEIVSGHTRTEGWCNVLGHDTIYAIIRPYPADPIVRFIEHKNMNQINRTMNSNFWAVEIRNAKITLRESGFVGTVEKEMDEVSKLLGKGKSSLYRYVAVSQLIPNLRNLEGDAIGTIALYEATKLNEEEQEELAEYIKGYYESFGTISKNEVKEKIKKMKKAKDGSLSTDKDAIDINDENPNVKEVRKKVGQITKYVRNFETKSLNAEEKKEVIDLLSSIIHVTNITLKNLTKDN